MTADRSAKQDLITSGEPLEVRYRNITDLKPYERNPRTHSKKQLRQIADSIEEFGFTNPVLIDGEDRIIAGHGRVEAGRLTILDHETRRPDPAAMVRLGVGRIPEDRHAEGLVGDMNVWENVIAERRNRPAFSRWGFLRRSKARAHAADLVRDFEVRCPSVDATVRQLSGGNMQKLILGRALALHPGLILANQPTRGLDIGAVAYVHQRLLEARDGGAAILLISEDLDEILALSDRVAVIHAGHLTPARPRAEVTVSGLGLLMAGAGDPDAGSPHPTTPEAAHAS